MTRSRTTERKRTREKQERRRRLVMLAVAAATLVVILAIFLITANQPTEAPIAEGAVERFPSELESRTTEGYPRFGRADAPLQVSWYCNFDSIDCATFHDGVIDQLATWARDGEILLTYVPLYGQSGNAQGAAQAVVCASEQQSAWPLISTFYNWRQAYGEVPSFTNNRIVSGIDQLPGVDRAAYDSCMRSAAPGATLVEANNDTRGLTSFTATPAVTLNNVVLMGGEENAQLTTAEAVLAALEQAIAGTVRTTPTVTPTTDPATIVEPTVEATSDAVEPTEAVEDAPAAATDAVEIATEEATEPAAEATAS